MALSITVSAGAPSNIAAGVYEVTLTGLDGPRTIFPQTGPNAGKEVEVLDWTFTTEDGAEIQGTTSTSSGPKSKLYAWLTALMGGKAPSVGSTYGLDQLLGRMAVATVEVPDSGWPRIANLSALPTKRQPVALRPAPVAPAADGDLPF